MSSAEVLDVADMALPSVGVDHAAADAPLNLHAATAKLTRQLIALALTRAQGNRAEAARLLGIARPQLYAKMKELGITPSDRAKP